MAVPDNIPMKILHDAFHDNWNTWREHYDQLNIDDLIWINLGLHHFVREQKIHNNTVSTMRPIFDKIGCSEDNINIIELGCYKGYLAGEFLRVFSWIHKWTGYDINYYAVSDPVVDDKRYGAIKQTEWFYDIEIDNEYDMFVSTSTIEHHSAGQFKMILNNIASSNIKYIALGMPLSDKMWRNYCGSHVIDIDVDSVTNMINDLGFRCFYYKKGLIIHTWGAVRIGNL